MSSICSDVRLNIQTYYAGNDQPTHPSIVSFTEKWNGYKYWMAYSPYPYGNGEEENPCIACSNDLLYWDIPQNFLNPIANNEEVGCKELKDPHILYRADLDRLEVWYLGRLHTNLGGDGKTLLIMRKTSSDGVHWSDFEVLTSTEYLSPSVIWDGEKYRLWEIGFHETAGKFVYRESKNAKEWTESIICDIGNLERNEIWHGAISVKDDAFYFVYIKHMKDSHTIFYCQSADGVHFSQETALITKDKVWDYFYRPFLLFDENRIMCVYGVVNRDNSWYLSANIGNEIDNLQRLSQMDVEKMFPVSSTVVRTDTFSYALKIKIKQVNHLFHGELFALVLPLLLVQCILRKADHDIALLLFGGVVLFVLAYTTRLNFRRNDLLSIFEIVILESVSIYAIAHYLALLFGA